MLSVVIIYLFVLLFNNQILNYTDMAMKAQNLLSSIKSGEVDEVMQILHTNPELV